MATLVVFYSLTGHTVGVGRAIAERLDATIAVIEEPQARKGTLRLAAGAAKALMGRPSVITATACDPAGFDLVILGTPVWVGAPAPAVTAYIDRHRGALDRVAFFATQARSGAAQAFARMERRLGHMPLAKMELAEGDLGAPAFDQKLDRFLSDLNRDRG